MFYNIVAILTIFTILCNVLCNNHIVIIYSNNIGEVDNMVNNIVAILFTTLPKSNILLTVCIVAICERYCEQFRQSLLMYDLKIPRRGF